MPIYEYQCQQCGHHHEALQKVSDPKLRQCPGCGRKSLKRLVSAVRFRLAGSGWYETDFKSDKEDKRNLHGEREEPKSDVSASDGKSDAKDTAKPDAKPEPAKSASAEPAASDKRSRVFPPAAASGKSKSNGRAAPKPARRASAARQRRR